MFEFEGEISLENKKRAIKKEKTVGFIICLITFVIFATFNVIVALSWELISLIFLIPLLCLPLGALLPSGKKELTESFPTRVYIDENDIISENNSFHHELPLDYIKIIKDFGEYYIIIFTCSTKESQFICQKNLLTAGTIEEFEKFFEDKIQKVQNI